MIVYPRVNTEVNPDTPDTRRAITLIARAKASLVFKDLIFSAKDPRTDVLAEEAGFVSDTGEVAVDWANRHDALSARSSPDNNNCRRIDSSNSYFIVIIIPLQPARHR
jgi:hypothetical protein